MRHKLIESTGNYLEIRPRKKGRFMGISEPMSTLILVFQEDELVRWYTDPVGVASNEKLFNRRDIPSNIAILLLILISVASGSDDNIN